MKKKFLIIVLSIVLLIAFAGVCFGGYVAACYISVAVADTSSTPYDSKYYMDEKFEFVANIPFADYLKQEELPEGDIFDVRNYGASIDKNTLQGYEENKEAIENAIKDCSENGGGTVLVDGGNYKCAPIELKSNVTLRITQNSSLENLNYDENIEYGSDEKAALNGFIYGKDLENVVIEGPGKLKGNGATYCKPASDSSAFYPLDTFELKTYIMEHRKRIKMGKNHEMWRDHLIRLDYCKNVTIRNIEMYEAGSWTIRIQGLENCLFEDVVINNDVNVANTDGIDIMGGKDIVIRHCFIATGDDALCLKTDPDNPPIENVLIENCEVMSLANCFKTGTAVYHDIKNVIVRDCYFFMAGIAGGYAGIAIEAPDGGKVENIKISNITMDHVTAPILVWLGYRHDGSSIDNIEIDSITAIDCDLPSAVTGYEKDGVKNVGSVKLSNINVTYRNAKEKLHFSKNKDKSYCGDMNMGGYPEITRVSHKYFINHTLSPYYDMPVYGLLVRYADNVTVTNFNVTPRECNTRELSNIELS